VVSTSDPAEARRLRAILERSILLVPGYGAQGLAAEAARALFKPDGTGALVNSSRSIIYAFENSKYHDVYGADWAKCIAQACADAVSDLARGVQFS
jgi:orotidine-5'-phosphate decarboxylase